MKTKLLATLMCTLLSYSAITCYAQSSNTSYNIENGILSGGKKGEGIGHVNLHVLRDFMTRFPLTTDVIWKKAADGYIATFTVASNETMVAYKENGKWEYTIKRYDDEKMLPVEVRALVKRTYYDYTITHIDEISFYQQENTRYLVIIQDDRNIKTVSVCNGEMEIAHELSKE